MSMQIYIQKSMHEERNSFFDYEPSNPPYGVCGSSVDPCPRMHQWNHRCLMTGERGFADSGFSSNPNIRHLPQSQSFISRSSWVLCVTSTHSISNVNTIITAFNPMTKCNRLFCFSLPLAQLHGCLPFLHLAILSL